MSMPRPHLRFALILLALLPASAAAQSPAVGGPAFGDPALSASPAIVGQPMTFAGSLGSGSSGTRVVVQVRVGAAGWHTVATSAAGAGGGFTAAWTTSLPGRFAVRAVASGGAVAAATNTAAAVITTTATVYRRAIATWYDLRGRTGACGVKITASTLGLAHKTLPCGSRVDVTFGGHTLNLPVIDRGPFARGVSYDLTRAASDRLGMTATGRATVGVLPAAERTPPAPALAGLFGGVVVG